MERRRLTACLPDVTSQTEFSAVPEYSERMCGRVSIRARAVRVDATPAIAEGHELIRTCLRRNAPGPYQIQGAIAAVHADAPTGAQTDWSQIVQLYEQLLTRMPTPIVALNRSIAIAELDGPDRALRLVDDLASSLETYHLFHATRAELLHRLDRAAESIAAYDCAIALATNATEIDHLRLRRASVAGG